MAADTNGIGDFFANRIRTKELCVSDGSGETCITKAQLDKLLSGQTAAAANKILDVYSLNAHTAYV